MVYTRVRQPMARGPNVALFKKMMAFLNLEEQKKGHQKKLTGLAKKNMIWPSTKKAYNFPIFWPTYHKRLATPGVHCTVYTVLNCI